MGIDMKKHLLILTILIFDCSPNGPKTNRKMASLTQTGNLDYCHINPHGYRQCNYRSLDKCNQARRFLEGICIKNEI